MKRHDGITMVELLVTIAIFTVVLVLLGYPLLAGFGYLQKATAGTEAQRFGNQVVLNLRADLETLVHVYPLPPDGSSLTGLKEAADAAPRSQGLPVEGLNATLVRYSRVLDFPWITVTSGGTTTFTLLEPNYIALSNPDAQVYDGFHVPFYKALSGDPNPFLLTRMERQVPWDNKLTAWYDDNGPHPPIPLDDSYPLWRYTGDREARLRQFHNDCIAQVPYGDEWDVARFQVSPLRVSTEALTRQLDAQNRQTGVVVSRYPLWAGRGRELDELAEGALPGIYGLSLANLPTFPTAAAPWPIYRLYPRGVNPYGYQIRVFNAQSMLVYGPTGLDTTTQQYTALEVKRHFMEWPPIDRPDFLTAGVLDPALALWTADDIARQRLEGRVVFEQPMAASTLTVIATDFGGVTIPTATLPIPPGWNENITYLASDAPLRLTCTVSGAPVTFTRVEKMPTLLGANEYCLINPDSDMVLPDAGLRSRQIALGSAMTATGDIPVTPVKYYICDLQPADSVVATYATQGVLDVALGISRQNRAASVGGSRQDYNTNIRVELRNAIKRAKGN